MAENYAGTLDERGASHLSTIHARTEESLAGSAQTGVIRALPAAHTIDPLRLNGRGINSHKAATMLQMQQTHGNRAVQRFIQRTPSTRATPLPVQRGDHDEDEPLIPKFTPFPYPTLDLPFGKGSGIAANPSGLDFNWKLGGANGKLGYEYDGNLTGEANLGDYWLKGGLGKKGFSLGGGYGNPLITPPGIPPMGNDPSGDLRGGDLDPRTLGKSLDDMKDSKIKPGFSWGLQGGKDEDKGYYGWGGLQYNW